MPLFVDIQFSASVLVTIVPEGDSRETLDYAFALRRELERTEISDRAVVVDVDSSTCVPAGIATLGVHTEPPPKQ